MESGKEHGFFVRCAALSHWKMLKGSFPWRPAIWLQTKQNRDLLMSTEVSVFLVKGEAKNGRKVLTHKSIYYRNDFSGYFTQFDKCRNCRTRWAEKTSEIIWSTPGGRWHCHSEECWQRTQHTFYSRQHSAPAYVEVLHFSTQKKISKLAEFWYSVGHLLTCHWMGIWCANGFETTAFVAQDLLDPEVLSPNQLSKMDIVSLFKGLFTSLIKNSKSVILA